MAKPHLAHPSDATLTRCGLPIAGPWPRPLPIVEAPTVRTCRRCLRALGSEQALRKADRMRKRGATSVDVERLPCGRYAVTGWAPTVEVASNLCDGRA